MNSEQSLAVPAEWVRPCRLAEASAPALLLPGSPYDRPCIVLGPPDGQIAICLSADFTFRGFPTNDGTTWSGLAIEDIQIELLLKQSYSSDEGRPIAGSFVRSGSALQFAYYPDERVAYRIARVVCADNLPQTTDGLEATFPDWQCVKFYGDQKIVLWQNTLSDSP